MRNQLLNSILAEIVRHRQMATFLMIGVGIAFLPLTASAFQVTGGAVLAGSDWDKVTSHGAGISGREAFASVAFDSNDDGQQEIWVFGGAYGNGTLRNTFMVEFSVAGNQWDEITTEPPWTPRSHFSAVVFDGKVWLFAGRGATTSDVWSSADCSSWTAAPDAPWGWREGYEAQVFNGKIWLMGGHDGQTKFHDVWSFDGTTWIPENDAPWTGRDGFSSAVLGGELYVIGGRGNNGTSDIVLSDVWKTSDGATWTEVNPMMDLGPRREHSTVAFDDRIWVIGGNVSLVDDDYDPTGPTSKMDDVWWSFDGAYWTASAEYGESPWHRTMNHESVVFTPAVPSDAVSAYQDYPRIWILGGRTQTTYERNTVWSDRRDHELVAYNSVAAGLPIDVKSPKGNQINRITESTITITDQDILVTDLNVSFDMTHSNWDDMRMRLVHFYTDDNGVEQEIRGQFIAPGYGMLAGNGRVEVTLEDDLSIPWLGGNVPITGALRFPNTYWVQFYGKPANGTWTLWLKDVARGNDGRLDSWSLELRGMPVPLSPGISVTPTSGLVTTEIGGNDSFDIVLDSQPAADVSIGISSSNTDEGTVDKQNLTFTSGNWGDPQTIIVTGVDDLIEDGDVAYTIVTGAATSTDPDYNGLDVNDVTVTNEDDDSPPGGGSVTYSTLDPNPDPDPSLAIPDNNSAGVSSTVFADDDTITNLTVNLNVSHPRPSDLDVFLIGPDDAQVQLFNFAGDNNVADFNDTSSLGFWTVKVIDSRRKKTGTLNSWSITVDY